MKKGDKVHLIGIKGVGMTALAQILLARGCKVTGSDGPEEFFTDAVLKWLKIPVAQKFAAKNIPVDVDVVVSSVAYYFGGKVLGSNPEVAETLRLLAQGKKLALFTYPQALGILANEYQVIAVAGSHGKSTTTAMLGWILEQIGFEPNVLVGTKVNGWESNARSSSKISGGKLGGRGSGPFLVIEADEYRDAFLNYKPFAAIITSIDYDHPDYFKTPAAYYNSFKKLVDNIDPKGFLVIEGDGKQTVKLSEYAKKCGLKVLTYGFSPENKMCRLVDEGIWPRVLARAPKPALSPARHNAKIQSVCQLFSILFYGRKIQGSVPFPGKQYVLNSGAAIVAAVMAGAGLEEATKAIATFPGTARRMEVLKKTKNYIIIDDYAHHPTAITITLEGIRAMYPGRKIICVFQPHMFSRTQALLKEFAKCFAPADIVGIMEIFPSARETSGPVNGADLAHETQKFHKHVTYLPTMESGKQFVKQFLKENNMIVLMGAGDVYKIAEQ